jgi:hypothetical protein
MAWCESSVVGLPPPRSPQRLCSRIPMLVEVEISELVARRPRLADVNIAGAPVAAVHAAAPSSRYRHPSLEQERGLRGKARAA